MLTPLARTQDQAQSLQGIIGWFNQNSVELIDEYRRLETRVDALKGQLAVKNRELEQSLKDKTRGVSFAVSY